MTASDIRFADELGYRIKLLATIKAGVGNAIEVRVCPTLIPKSHVLASVNGVYNAIAVRGDIVGETLFYGRGAGQDPTSSSVLSDLAEASIGLKVRGFAMASPRTTYMANVNQSRIRCPSIICG